MFASRVRVYPAIHAIPHHDQVDYDVDEDRSRQAGMHADGVNSYEADAFDDADGCVSDDVPLASDNDGLPEVEALANADKLEEAELEELNDSNFDFDESMIDVVHGDMTWHRFSSFTHAISARCAMPPRVETFTRAVDILCDILSVTIYHMIFSLQCYFLSCTFPRIACAGVAILTPLFCRLMIQWPIYHFPVEQGRQCCNWQ
jgi:hypothetical protein